MESDVIATALADAGIDVFIVEKLSGKLEIASTPDRRRP